MMIVVLLLVLVSFTIFTFYYGFVKPIRTWAWRLQAAFVVGAMLSTLIAVAWVKQLSGPGNLRRLVDLYPGARATVQLPLEGGSRHWQFASRDPPATVFGFYSDASRYPGWEVVGETVAADGGAPPKFYFLVLERADTSLLITIRSEEETTIIDYDMTADIRAAR